ncbi:TNF receptor-associated factor 3 [Desmophyllum pertusum]|uniref:TNF receptor-associated factor 3 n=1 Tax=Desmophyllum pertusum TaxID=174260 RepID=A0A9W9ZNM5_9CNID|nr:TNF receptor-associated factor 3 [Desmophyllum pertusum]
MAFFNSVIEFVKGELEERYKCINCRYVLRDPAQSSCGHRFCWLCLEEILTKAPTDPRCPDDNEPLQKHLIFKDKCAQKEILDLECYCPKKSLGCQWCGKLAQLQAHDAECSFSEVKCLYVHLGCIVVVLRHQLAKHVENDCLYKVVDCPYCQGGFSGVKMREHLEVCGKFPVKCPDGCDKSDILREALEEHSQSCPRAPVQCKFSSMGCSFRGSRESLEEHLRSHTTEHLTFSGKFIEKVLEQMKTLEIQLNAAQERNQNYEARLALQNEALALNKQTLFTHQVKLARVEENLDAHRRSMDELRQSLETTNNSKENKQASDEVKQRLNLQDERIAVLADELTALGAAEGPRMRPRDDERASMASLAGSNHRFDRVEHSLTLHEIQLADQDIKLQILETTSHDGVFLWKVDNFQRRFRESVEGKTISIYSPPFYTSRYGYKLCARAYLNGDGPMGKGKYLSLFIVLMRGEYDGLLSWPFQNKITMKLVDQEQISHITETFRPDPNSSSFQRPKSEMNIASGCPLFCSHGLLRSRGYIRDDSLFIKLVVEGTGVPMI